MDSIQKVFQRIATIEQRFGHPNQLPSVSFGDTLESVLKNKNPDNSGYQMNVESIIRAAAKKYGVDPKLAMAVAVAESGLQPDVVSPAGAVGVMQLMPETARSLGVVNLKDPRENIDAGVRYLKQMLNTFNGDVVKAVAAYNAGSAAVAKYGGVPPYPETREYVNKVIALSR